jgi:hypothetical protein
MLTLVRIANERHIGSRQSRKNPVCYHQRTGNRFQQEVRVWHASNIKRRMNRKSRTPK